MRGFLATLIIVFIWIYGAWLLLTDGRTKAVSLTDAMDRLRKAVRLRKTRSYLNSLWNGDEDKEGTETISKGSTKEAAKEAPAPIVNNAKAGADSTMGTTKEPAKGAPEINDKKEI
jgi:hypothetical protein